MKYELIIDKNAEEKITALVHAPSSLTRQIEDLVCSCRGAESIVGYADGEMRRLAFAQIEYVTVMDRKVLAVDVSGRFYRLQERLYELEGILPSYFIRINKSTLANEHRIERFCATFHGAVDAVFLCGCREYVSRRCFAEIRRRYE